MHDWRDALLGLGVVGLLVLGGFLGWHMTILALALATLIVLFAWVRIASKLLHNKEDEWANLVASVMLILVIGMWLGTIARPLSAFLNGKTLRLATDMFIR